MAPATTTTHHSAPVTLEDAAHGCHPPRDESEVRRHWLTYRQAAAYCGWSVNYVRNLVSAGQIPVYGKPRVRRFRRDMLDLFLTNPDAAMRKFRAERNSHGS
jgi:excisionase family DNA binding protein